MLGTGCTQDAGDTQGDGTTGDAGPAAAGGGPNDLPPLPEGHARVVHSWGEYTLPGGEELEPCLQWTLNNDEALYINRVDFINNGGFHHTNWFVIPETQYPGDDGFFDCDERGFNELASAVAGTVLFAQSTQSRVDGLQLPPGVVVKIPPRHKIVAGGHLLNLSSQAFTTEARMTLELIHPKEVEVVTAPFRLSYVDLDIPPLVQSRFGSDCDLNAAYMEQLGEPLDLKIYYAIPHFHGMGNYFDLSISGGARDAESILRLDGFNADNNGRAYDPPVDLTGATGVQFTCGYNNWRNESIGWGIGDQEMCVMLGLADSRLLMDASVVAGNTVVGVNDDGVRLNSSSCGVIGLPKNDAQGPPTAEELAAPLYVPPTAPADADLPSVPPCVDTPADAIAQGPATLSAIKASMFSSSCAFSSCHQGTTAVVGLDLTAEDLHGELLAHQVAATTSLALIDAGNPAGSYLYQLISQCDPSDGAGGRVSHMPLNAPFLSDPGLVAQVRDWIAAGAKND